MTEPRPELVPRPELTKELYGVLRALAGRALGHGLSRLDPTDLVHHAWVRLARAEQFREMPRAEFLALCATIMRRLAVDEGRRRARERRAPTLTLTGFPEPEPNEEPLDIVALDEALERLREYDERWARVIELRFFGGLTADEVAALLGLSRRTVTREWTLARAWLKRALGEAQGRD